MKCNICGEQFSPELEPGAIFWGHPEKDNRCPKYHVCRKCEPKVLELMSNPDVQVELGKDDELYDADPDCDHNIVPASGGGVKCTECSGWFCF